jgi:hypothetical protein
LAQFSQLGEGGHFQGGCIQKIDSTILNDKMMMMMRRRRRRRRRRGKMTTSRACLSLIRVLIMAGACE